MTCTYAYPLYVSFEEYSLFYRALLQKRPCTQYDMHLCICVHALIWVFLPTPSKKNAHTLHTFSLFLSRSLSFSHILSRSLSFSLVLSLLISFVLVCSLSLSFSLFTLSFSLFLSLPLPLTLSPAFSPASSFFSSLALPSVLWGGYGQ